MSEQTHTVGMRDALKWALDKLKRYMGVHLKPDDPEWQDLQRGYDMLNMPSNPDDMLDHLDDEHTAQGDP